MCNEILTKTHLYMKIKKWIDCTNQLHKMELRLECEKGYNCFFIQKH